MKIVSLFSGCGGLDLGFEQAGFDVIWANEFDKTICETYRLNHPNTTFCDKDIRTIKSADIPECDGIIGGPPCQSWSIGGKGRGIYDERGKLFFDYIRIVEEKKPKFFLIENVAGILEEKHKHAFSTFINRLQEAGYSIEYKLLNAANYIIPQDRFRVFIIGIRKDLNIKYFFPEPTQEPFVTLKKAIGDIDDNPQFSDGYIEPRITKNGLWNHDVYTGPYSITYMNSNRVRAWDDVSFTIQAQAANAPQHPSAPKMPISPNGGREFKKGYEHLYRRLSVRECARIQSFPDSFHFIYSNIKDGYKMVGNAVPPRLAKLLAKQFIAAFENSPHNSKCKLGKISPLIVNKLADYPNLLIKTNSRLDSHPTDEKVILCLIKQEIESSFLNKNASIYYTGKKFPSTIVLNQLFYFMPYIKGKGVRDLYLIKTVKIGRKSDIYPNSNDSDYRIIFELEYVMQLFNTFMPLKLNIWHTFTDTSIGHILEIFES